MATFRVIIPTNAFDGDKNDIVLSEKFFDQSRRYLFNETELQHWLDTFLADKTSARSFYVQRIGR
jgi:hypothetical protein